MPRLRRSVSLARVVPICRHRLQCGHMPGTAQNVGRCRARLPRLHQYVPLLLTPDRYGPAPWTALCTRARGQDRKLEPVAPISCDLETNRPTGTAVAGNGRGREAA